MSRLPLDDSARRIRSGYTLIELLVSSAAATMLMVGMASAMFIATKAMSPQPEHLSVLQGAETSIILADDLQSAVHITAQSDAMVEFALQDRTGDGAFETIRYAFDSDANALIRADGGQTGTLAADLKSFSLSPIHRQVTEMLGGVVSASSDTMLSGVTSGDNLRTWYVSPYFSPGQFLDIAHPANTVAWSISEVTLLLRRRSWYAYGEQLIVQIREATGDGLPTSRVFGEARIDMSSLTTSWQWKSLSISGAERMLRTQKVCIVVLADDSYFGESGRVGYSTSGFTPAGHMVGSLFYDSDWRSWSGRSLYFTVSGTRFTLDDTSHEVSRNYITGYDIAIAADGATSPVRRRVRLMNTPEQVGGLWRLDFNKNPVIGIDVDFDGTEDWTYTAESRFSPDISGSVLKLISGQSFQTTAENDFAGLITLDVHCRATSTSTSGGAAVTVPFGADTGNSGQVAVSVMRSADATQTAKVTAKDGVSEQLLVQLNNLPADMVEFRVVIDSDANQVAVWVNEEFQGRSVVTQPLSGAARHATFGAVGANAEFDFLSLRVGGNQ